MDRLNTYEKQKCVEVTHYSKTTISNCTTQKTCYKEIQSNLDFYKSNKLPKNLNNKIEFYKNNLASSVFYFNESKDNLDIINKACKNNKFEKDLIDNINSLSHNILLIFNYVDKNNKESIEILKNYAIFLKNQDVNYISEEEIYSDFITINNNLNDLRTGKENTDTYIGQLNSDAKNINYHAQQLGFKNTYLSKINYSDLYAYYYDISTNAENTFLTPKNTLSSSYIIKTISRFESYKKFNENIKKLDIYNLYLLFDKIIGFENSTTTIFRDLNNKISKNIDKVYENISTLEINIENNLNYLSNTSKGEFIKYKYDYQYNNLSFGKYLSKLKIFNLEIQENNLKLEQVNNTQNKKIEDCDNFINNINNKNLNDNYIIYLIKKYNSENNFEEKINYCNKIKNNKSTTNNCNILHNIQNSEIEFTEIKLINISDYNDSDCLNIINNLNYILINNTKLKEINTLIENIEDLLIENKKLKYYSLDIDKITTYIKELKTKENYEFYLEYDKIKEDLEKYKIKILEINKINLEDYLSNNQTITYNSTNKIYELILYNPYNYKIANLIINCNYNDLIINSNNIEFKKNTLYIDELELGENKYEINYNNEQKITITIRSLNKEIALLEINITNTIENLDSIINIGDIKNINFENYSVDQNYNINFKTKKENKLLVYKKILNISEISKTIDKINDDTYIEKTIYDLKSEYNNKINTDFEFVIVSNDSQIRVITNYKEQNFNVINNTLVFNLNLNAYEKQIYEIQILENKDSITNKIYDLFAKKEILDNCLFENIVEESKNINLDFKEFEEYELLEIKNIFDKKHLVDNLWLYYEELQNIESVCDLKINELELKNLTSSEIKKLELIIKNKYKNIEHTFYELQNLEEEINNRINIQKEDDENNLNTILDDMIKNTENKNILNKDILEIYDLAKNNNNIEEKENYISQIENKIKNKYEEELKKIDAKIDLFSNIDTDELEDNLNLLYYQYEEISLSDLYNINYYPKITLYDLDSISKNYKDINTKSFLNKIENYEIEKNKENYSKALDIINSKVIDNLDYIVHIDQYLKETINELDSENLTLIKEIESNNQYSSEFINNIKENYNSKKYLKNIYLINNEDTTKKKNTNNILQTQNIIILLIFLGLFVSYLYYNKPKKKIDIKERKMRVIRHY